MKQRGALQCGTLLYRNGHRMSVFLNNAATLVAVLVFVVLAAGLFNLLRLDGGNMSQKLMRWRVGLQFVAIALVVFSALLANYA